MSVPEIVPRAMFSLRTDVKYNAHYISDFQIIYPAGSVLILHNHYEKRQKYIKLFERSVYLEMLCISPSRKLVALIENGDRGQILIFDLQTLKRKRTLNLPVDAQTNRFETISFTHDDVYIMAVTGEPDWNLVMYKWEKGKVTSTTKAVGPLNTSSAIVTQIICNPNDNNEVCLVGPGLFRLLTMNETVWRQYGFSKADQINITSVCYCSNDLILCGTVDAKLFFVENGELKGVYNALTSNVLSIKDKEESASLGSSSLLVIKTHSGVFDGVDLSVRALVSFPKGFVYSCKTGVVHMFEKEGPHKYKKRNVFKVIDLANIQDGMNAINHLSINVSQDKLLATTKLAQIYTVRLWGPDINVAPEIPFRHFGEPLHHGSINGLTLCVWKPLFATFGKIDRTIRVWNYESETVILVKHIGEDIYAIDFHPTGIFIAIGLTDKISLSTVLMNDIQQFRSLPIAKCEQIKYNCIGNFLAAVNENWVDIFNAILLQLEFVLKGHLDVINTIHWAPDDKRIAACGSNGTICIWETIKGALVIEMKNPGVNVGDFSWSPDGKYMYYVASDGLLREMSDGVILRTISLNQSSLGNLALSRSGLMLFVTGDNCSIISVRMPLSQPPEYLAFNYHSTRITEIRMSYDDQTVISVSEGGSVIIWKLNNAEGKTVAMDKNFIYSMEVLINKQELEKKMNTIKELSQKLYEVEVSQIRETRDTESHFCENIRELHETYGIAIDELREKVEQTEADQTAQLAAIKKDIDELKAKQNNEKNLMIENYTSKLLTEYEKVKVIDAIKQKTIRDFEIKVAELEKAKEEETNEIIRIYAEKLEETNNLLQQTFDENAKNIQEHETIKQQLEDDADREIIEMKAKYEAILKEEKELSVVLKEETYRMRKKFAEAQKERDDICAKLERLQEEQQKYLLTIQSLEKDIIDLKGEISDRESAIEDKEKRIIGLKKKIQELEKFKFVLDYKIKELINQIDPKDREIRERKEQIADMEVELHNLKKINSSLELQLEELREKINGTEREMSNYEKKYQIGVNVLRQIKVDIYLLNKDIDNFKELKEGTKNLYHKYYKDETVPKEQYGDTDLQKELLLQREFLEKTIIAIQNTLKKGQLKKSDRGKVLQDNVVLLEELNLIRKELKVAVTTVRSLEKLVRAKGRKAIIPSEAYTRFEQALKKQDSIRKLYQDVIDDAKIETELLNSTTQQIQDKLFVLMEND